MSEDNKKKYITERNERWKMAEDGEEPAIVYICNKLSAKLNIPIENIKYVRYDELVFENYDPKLVEWAKGCPDYMIEYNDNESDNSKYLYFEIKLKQREFRKTNSGGVTQAGSIVPNYGCPSYYLDVVPVHTNMNDFCEKMSIDKQSFIVAFVSLDNDNKLQDVRLISLLKINNIVKYGFSEPPGSDDIRLIGTFKEGFGQEAYLIPKSQVTTIEDISPEQFKDVSTKKTPITKLVTIEDNLNISLQPFQNKNKKINKSDIDFE